MRGQKDTRPCANCGTLLTRLLSQARGKHWYCNYACQAAHAPSPITLARIANPLRGETDTRPCVNCGMPVTRYLSQRRLAQVWTCSRMCLGAVTMAQRVAAGTWKTGQKKRRGETNPCEVCGTPVYRNATQAARGEGRFCSQECHNIAQTKEAVVKPCATCGSEMRLKPSQAARRYCKRACMARGAISRPLDRMHNGKPARLDPKGYVLIWEPEHPNKSMKGWHFEHRIMVERILGRYLTREEHVDHINQQKADNRLENLQVLSPSAHSVKTWQDRVSDLSEYRRLYGPLPKKE